MKKTARMVLSVLLSFAMLFTLLPSGFMVNVQADDYETTTKDVFYQQVTVTYDDYVWSENADGYYEMSGYYYLTDGTYEQVYYTYTETASRDSSGNYDKVITLYYGDFYTELGTSFSNISSGSVTLYLSYQSFYASYEKFEASFDSVYKTDDTSSDTSDSTSTDTSSDTYHQLMGFYYKLNDTLYDVYFLCTTENGSVTSATIYYKIDGSYVSIGTLYPDDAGSDEFILYSYYELNISAYQNDGLVYWDINNYDNDIQEEADYISSVTLGGYDVTFGESTDLDSWSGGLSLSTVYTDSDGNAVSDQTFADTDATLTITPTTGYYVKSVIIVCAPYDPVGQENETDESTSTDSSTDNGISGNGMDNGGSGNGMNNGSGGNMDNGNGSGGSMGSDNVGNDGGSKSVNTTYERHLPYQCSTYISENAYTQTFEEAKENGYVLSVDVSNIYFAHSGFLETSSNAIYFILVEVEEIPDLELESTLLKFNEDWELLEGAEYELSAVSEEESTVISSGTTDENGTINLGYLDFTSLISEGYTEYVLSETAAPEGYEQNEDVTLTLENGMLYSSETSTYGITQYAVYGYESLINADTGEEVGVTVQEAAESMFLLVLSRTQSGEEPDAEDEWYCSDTQIASLDDIASVSNDYKVSFTALDDTIYASSFSVPDFALYYDYLSENSLDTANTLYVSAVFYEIEEGLIRIDTSGWITDYAVGIIAVDYEEEEPVSDDPVVEGEEEDEEGDEDIEPAFMSQWIPEGTKVLEGKDLEDAEFTFTFSDEEGILFEARNDEEGTFSFDEALNEALFDGEGTYTFYVEEVIEDEEYVTYDESVFALTAVVTLEDNEYYVDWTITEDGEEADEIIFTNVYEEPTELEETDTGDYSHVSVYLMSFMICMFGVYIISRRRKSYITVL